ncbi:Retrovirus-related Pol polyprotein from transposon 17.6 [Gossypium australe]|uniref:Retrovirus-related Pol polyprotein from transposon 17.6 n=1 Tax=Gossypium australe TaxID=47621 RepID=A0A5B6VKA3_9ROSI|nr:Retrovirus-related Pol polyprotein from transposon 17.6 [Gossypium australe]
MIETTFTCPFGTYAFKRMPFGLCNALATFMICMTMIFADMLEEGLDAFIDDFSMYKESFQECLDNLKKMLKRLEETNLVLNWEKCHFMNLPNLKNVKGVRNFLGNVRFYPRFIKDFAHISKPLNQLLQKETPFIFDQSCIKSFKVIKENLYMLLESLPQIVDTFLGQKWNNLFGAIHYGSKTLNSARCNYTTTEKEMLAVVFVCKKFRPYLMRN